MSGNADDSVSQLYQKQQHTLISTIPPFPHHTYISSCGLGKCTTAHGREGGGAQDNFQLIITQLMMITQYDDDDDDDNTVC